MSILKKCREFGRAHDNFGNSVHINYRGKATYGTALGGYVSLLARWARSGPVSFSHMSTRRECTGNYSHQTRSSSQLSTTKASQAFQSWSWPIMKQTASTKRVTTTVPCSNTTSYNKRVVCSINSSRQKVAKAQSIST